ncbi:hypothetical protein STEG23_015041, partial [Scotinomys teguina]
MVTLKGMEPIRGVRRNAEFLQNTTFGDFKKVTYKLKHVDSLLGSAFTSHQLRKEFEGLVCLL